MLLCLFGILVIHWMEAVSAVTSSSSDRTSHRDYANKIGMVCSYDITESGSLYMELGENDKIGDKLEPFGRNRKVIFYILGYSTDMNPDDNGETLAQHTSDTKAWIKDKNTVVCRFDYVHEEEVQDALILPTYRKQVQERVPFAAKIITSVVAEMYKKVFHSFENFDLVGYSLGAHVAGFTAKLIKAQFGEIVPRIFALDPSKTLVFNNRMNELEKTDAKYVQAIFTSSLGKKNIDVHCKVFINDGSLQPGCEKMLPLIRSICSHRYAARLYHQIAAGRELYAFNTKAKKNEKYGMMVGHLSYENASGEFHLKTDN